MPAPHALQVKLPDETRAAIRARGVNDSVALRTMVSRYLYMLSVGRLEVRESIHADDVVMLHDLVTDTAIPDPGNSLRYRAGQLSEDDYAMVGADKARTLAALDGLSYAATMAVVDAVERYRLASAHGFDLDPARLLD